MVVGLRIGKAQEADVQDLEKNEGRFSELYMKLGHGPRQFSIRSFELLEGLKGTRLL